MRIYTEVIFEWDDKQGKLVETSSESFDYQGEMALAGADWYQTDLGYDKDGNKWHVRATEDRYETYKNGVVISTSMIDAYDGAVGAMRTGVQVASEEIFGDKFYLANNKGEGGVGYEGMWETNEALAAYLLDLHDADWAHEITGLYYDEANNSWGEQEPIEFGFSGEGIDDGDGDGDGDGVDPEGDKAFLESAILGYVQKWKSIVDPEIYDAFESEIDRASEALKFAAEDVAEAKGDLAGDIEDIQEDYTTAETAAETLKEEGLETTVTAREEELEALREEAGGEIRAAEAKIGAAGFASTGVGKTAREVLAEEIGKEATDIDVGFTEKRGDLKSDYITDVGDLKKTRTRAGEDVGDPWEDASDAYRRLESGYEEIISGQTKEAEAELGDLQIDIFGAISDIQGMRDEAGTGFLYGQSYNPFAEKGILAGRGGEFGWTGDIFKPTFTEGLFGEYDEDAAGYEYEGTTYKGQYERFDPTSVEGFELFDPTKIRLPWETPTPPEGDPTKPGGQG